MYFNTECAFKKQTKTKVFVILRSDLINNTRQKIKMNQWLAVANATVIDSLILPKGRVTKAFVSRVFQE